MENELYNCPSISLGDVLEDHMEEIPEYDLIPNKKPRHIFIVLSTVAAFGIMLFSCLFFLKPKISSSVKPSSILFENMQSAPPSIDIVKEECSQKIDQLIESMKRFLEE